MERCCESRVFAEVGAIAACSVKPVQVKEFVLLAPGAETDLR